MIHSCTFLWLIVVAFYVTPVFADRLPNGEMLRPTGISIAVDGTMAANMVRIPGKPWVALICSGARQSLSIVDFNASKVLSLIQFQILNVTRSGYTNTGSAYYGLAVSEDGKTLYASRGGEDRVASYAVGDDGGLTISGTYTDAPAPPAKSNFPSGIALDSKRNEIYAANNLSDTLSVIGMASGVSSSTSTDVGSYPLTLAFDPVDDKLYVSSERDSCVTEMDTSSKTGSVTIPVGSHPDALLFSKEYKRLFVANGDSDTVSIIDTATNAVVRTLLMRPSQAQSLPGATPTGLAISPDQSTLYVALADMNALAVVQLNATRDDGQVIGYVPTGWYPTALSVSDDGDTLIVANAKGSTASVPNPKGPNPVNHRSIYKSHNILTSTVSVIPKPNSKTLRLETKQVMSNNSIGSEISPDSARISHLLKSLPIKHVIYIIKENRTYDEVLGDIKQGNGDPRLTLFEKSVTPNQHALAEQFVLLDNFYCCAEVSPDGWNWSTSGFAEEYTQRTTPEFYSENGDYRPRVRSYDYEGDNRGVPVSLQNMPDVAESPGGYIWDAVAKAGLTYRNYGAFLSSEALRPSKPVLQGHTDPSYAPFDMQYPDSDAYSKWKLKSPGKMVFGIDNQPSRFSAWKTEFDGHVKGGDLPAFELLRLPRDHTAATYPGLNTPQAMAADNDYAVGEIVQAVSHSPFWKNTAIIIVEDDAQDGPDHVDCHRSTAYIVSPYIKRGSVDHHFYNTDSLLRTMEIFLRIPPMTRFDSIAPPIGAFTDKATMTPFDAIVPDQNLLAAMNTPGTPGAGLSRRMNFKVADDAPEDTMNQILWRSIKGVGLKMPPPRHNVLGQ